MIKVEVHRDGGAIQMVTVRRKELPALLAALHKFRTSGEKAACCWTGDWCCVDFDDVKLAKVTDPDLVEAVQDGE